MFIAVSQKTKTAYQNKKINNKEVTKVETSKYLIIYHRNGLFYTIGYGDNNKVEHYLEQGFVVAIFDDKKHAVEALNDYQKYISE